MNNNLEKQPLFSSWSYSVLYKLLFAIEENIYNKNEVVYNQGDLANSFFIIQEGEFVIYK